MKNLLRKIIQKTGYDFKRIPIDPIERQQINLLKKYGINLVFDIGANAGQYARKLRKMGYKGQIVSFEPLPNAFLELKKKADLDSKWIAVYTAMGDKKGTTLINIAKNSYSSSILEMLPAHIESAPQSAYIDKTEVSVETVDSMVDKYFTSDSRLFIKIDTQGYERKVFEGSVNSLSKIKGFQMELSRLPLYAEETLFNDMVDLLDEHGFKLMMLENGFCQPRTGELLQLDGFFFKPILFLNGLPI